MVRFDAIVGGAGLAVSGVGASVLVMVFVIAVAAVAPKGVRFERQETVDLNLTTQARSEEVMSARMGEGGFWSRGAALA